MTLEELLESFYVDAGLTDEAERGALAPEGDVERWLTQARLKLGPIARRSTPITWEAGASVIPLPPDCASVERITLDSGSPSLPAYDEWGQALALRQSTTSSGSGTAFYTGYYDVPSVDTRAPDPHQDAAGLACISYALSRFYRKLAGSRIDYRRYATITGQSGVDAGDLRDLADDHLGDFESARGDLAVTPSSSYYGD